MGGNRKEALSHSAIINEAVRLDFSEIHREQGFACQGNISFVR